MWTDMLINEGSSEKNVREKLSSLKEKQTGCIHRLAPFEDERLCRSLKKYDSSNRSLERKVKCLNHKCFRQKYH